jgi:hypothetical protein
MVIKVVGIGYCKGVVNKKNDNITINTLVKFILVNINNYNVFLIMYL